MLPTNPDDHQVGVSMQEKIGKPFIGWLELAVSPTWHNSMATLHQIDMDDCQRCFGVTVDHRWLCGSDGSPTLFDSMAAATRFLNLLNVNRIAQGGRRKWNLSEQETVQCFRLGAKGLTACKKCCIAVEARLQPKTYQYIYPTLGDSSRQRSPAMISSANSRISTRSAMTSSRSSVAKFAFGE